MLSLALVFYPKHPFSMSGIQKNILIFFALLGAGAAMLWLVWRVQGTFGFVFGILGALLIIISLKWMEIVLREQEVEKRALQQEFETLYGVGKREVSGPAFKPIENPVLRKKLAWIFGSLALVCGALVDAGCGVLMPLAAPIGTARGVQNPYALKQLREDFPNIPLIVDAGLGAPSHAVQAMELGYDAILLNTAVAKAGDSVLMAQAFSLAVQAGRLGYLGKIMPPQDYAAPSSPEFGTPFSPFTGG